MSKQEGYKQQIEEMVGAVPPPMLDGAALIEEMCKKVSAMFVRGHDGVYRGSVQGIPEKIQVEMGRLGMRRFAENCIRPMQDTEFRFSSLGLFAKPKEKGFRFICKSTDIDRIRQRAMTELLCDCLDSKLSPHTYGFRTGYSALDAVTALRDAVNYHRFDCVLLTDVVRCFPSIPVKAVINCFQQHGISPLMLSWLKSAYINRPSHALIRRVRNKLSRDLRTTGRDLEYLDMLHQNKVGIPEGSALSPIACNLFLQPILSSISNALPDIAIVHYADNLAFAMRGKRMHQLRQLLEAAAARLELKLEYEVLRLGDGHTSEFLGHELRINNKRLDLSPGRKMKEQLLESARVGPNLSYHIPYTALIPWGKIEGIRQVSIARGGNKQAWEKAHCLHQRLSSTSTKTVWTPDDWWDHTEPVWAS